MAPVKGTRRSCANIPYTRNRRTGCTCIPRRARVTRQISRCGHSNAPRPPLATAWSRSSASLNKRTGRLKVRPCILEATCLLCLLLDLWAVNSSRGVIMHYAKWRDRRSSRPAHAGLSARHGSSVCLARPDLDQRDIDQVYQDPRPNRPAVRARIVQPGKMPSPPQKVELARR
jgi:hypothetical protein